MYQTTGGQGLSRELKVAAQERQKLFLQEIKECLITPLPPAASDATLGRREKEKEVHSSAILAILVVTGNIFRSPQIDH